MTPSGYADIVRLMVLALGAAILLGTGAALLRYRRMGMFPGQSPEDSPDRSARGLRGAWVKLAIGAALFVWGLVTLLVAR